MPPYALDLFPDADENTTRTEHIIHAWSYDKATEYLARLATFES